VWNSNGEYLHIGETCAIEIILDEEYKMIGGEGELKGFWRGNREYFNGGVGSF
jgi:hypothetical protein